MRACGDDIDLKYGKLYCGIGDYMYMYVRAKTSWDVWPLSAGKHVGNGLSISLCECGTPNQMTFKNMLSHLFQTYCSLHKLRLEIRYMCSSVSRIKWKPVLFCHIFLSFSISTECVAYCTEMCTLHSIQLSINRFKKQWSTDLVFIRGIPVRFVRQGDYSR